MSNQSKFNKKLLTDIQHTTPEIKININKVGIRDIIMPVKISTKCFHTITSIAKFSIYVNLDKTQKGTHMSRFITELQEYINTPISSISLGNICKKICKELNATESFIECSFKYFINKKAPISNYIGLMDYNVIFKVHHKLFSNESFNNFNMIVSIPITTVCPCSKEISDSGAHNQRGIITISINISPDYDEIIWIEDIIHIAEFNASCELYPILKRKDEKYVTEKGYDNPNFVEDIVRKIAVIMDTYKEKNKIINYIIEIKTYESIHNHNAYAMIRN